ncbi:FAD-binding oxidoreductase [Streptosporangium sp. NBC_01639]|uniref:globin domain-containing protein n=1 Tax=Streptosporangium sp. NBC_01639 TaxID=2975948 RepID=UPI00386783C2|nr:FAD-binding oxidoreductase [Streptosporangium sp. NBC_01639]
MLSPESTATVRATLPVIGGAVENITARFYEMMFADNPELLRDLFNRGNQANGEQRSALAGSIAAFAAVLVEPSGGRPDTMLARIANKHASLGVTVDQYEIVHKYLFAAIAEVLGDAVTPEVAAAWDEVYWLMADTLITLETDLYRDAGEGWLQATVLDRRRETEDVISLTLRPATSLSFKPGQYVSVAVSLPDGARQIRQYSLSCAPERDDWRITVKRVRGGDVPDGEVSNWLHANVQTGDTLTISPPFGDLVLSPGDTPLLLASAGIGATPILSMVDHLAATGSARRVTVVHADRSPAGHAHREELERLIADLPDATLHRWYEEPGDCSCRPAPNIGQADLTETDLPAGLTAYLCGPLPFMRSVRSQLLRRGVPASDIHYEVFGPDLWLGRS